MECRSFLVLVAAVSACVAQIPGRPQLCEFEVRVCILLTTGGNTPLAKGWFVFCFCFRSGLGILCDCIFGVDRESKLHVAHAHASVCPRLFIVSNDVQATDDFSCVCVVCMMCVGAHVCPLEHLIVCICIAVSVLWGGGRGDKERRR